LVPGVRIERANATEPERTPNLAILATGFRTERGLASVAAIRPRSFGQAGADVPRDPRECKRRACDRLPWQPVTSVRRRG
jgi:hypothetical protein